MPNIEGRYSVYFKKDLAKRFHPSTFNIRCSIFCGSRFSQAAKAGRLTTKKPRHFGYKNEIQVK